MRLRNSPDMPNMPKNSTSFSAHCTARKTWAKRNLPKPKSGPSGLTTARMMRFNLLAQASLAMQVGDFKTAEPLLDNLVQDHPEFSEAWNRRATMYYMQGRFKESLADIAKVLALEPRHFGALSGKGAVLRALGKPAEALAAMKEALAIDPNIAGLKDAIEELQKTEPEL